MNTRSISSAIVLALLISGVALALKFLQRDHLIAPEMTTRAFQVMIGLVLAFYGNIMPKGTPNCGDAWSKRKQTLLRVGGWAFVIAGLGYAGIWLVAPMGSASDASMALVAAATAITLVWTVWTVATRPRRTNPGA
jgi:hypothetical protein